MKTAQELRAGNVFMVGNDPMVVQKSEYNKSGRNAAVVKIVYKDGKYTVPEIGTMKYVEAGKQSLDKK